MKFEPRIPFTRTIPAEGAPESIFEDHRLQEESRTIRCDNPERAGLLAFKLEEYTRRAQVSVNKVVVRNAICKMAVLDLLLNLGDQSANYFEAFDYAKEGLEAYGANLLIESPEEAEQFFNEFDEAFWTIDSYVKTGNEFVTGGTQLPEFS